MLTRQNENLARSAIKAVDRRVGNPFLIALLGSAPEFRLVREKYIGEFPKMTSFVSSIPEIRLVALDDLPVGVASQCMVHVADMPLSMPGGQADFLV